VLRANLSGPRREGCDRDGPHFGDLLRQYRRAAGLTQEELAEQASVSPRSISGWESGGAHLPRRDTLAMLMRALGLQGLEREALESSIERQPTRRHFTPGRPEHNLPRTLSSFVGREGELLALRQLLSTTPLLTLVGTGGVGKTRLALELVRSRVTSYADGVWVVELAPVVDGAVIPAAVATALGIRDAVTRNVIGALVDHLRGKELLLVFDNCEHQVDACARLAAHLLRKCPRLQIVATSREPLAVEGEMAWRVPPLDLPDSPERLSPEQMLSTASVRLFVERVHAVNQSFVLSEANAQAVARICVGVDGIPLALELAAARAQVLTVEQLAERLEYDSGTLGRAVRTGLPRHRTIRATIDWSHELLDDREQVLLRRVSVFAGGWTLAIAESICPGPEIRADEVLELLTGLIDKSMALVDASDNVARYRLLEPIRQYAMERLEASGEAATYRSRHALAFLSLAGTNDVEPARADEIASLQRLEAEHDNLRAALRWTLDHGPAETGLRATAAMFRFWERRGLSSEGRDWLEQALARAGEEAPPKYHGRVLSALANFYWRGGEPARARPLTLRALELARAAGDVRGEAWALFSLGMIAYFLGESEAAIDDLEACLPLARQAGHLTLQSLTLTFIGRILLWSDGPDHPRVSEALDESFTLAAAAESRYATGHMLLTLGDLAWRQGEAGRALGVWRQALEVRTQLADRRGITNCLERLAWGLAATGRFEPAGWLLGAVETQRGVLGMPLQRDELLYHADALAATSAPWRTRGRAARQDEAIRYALSQVHSQVRLE
jgi:non-specific serine/threonine protein kinase